MVHPASKRAIHPERPIREAPCLLTIFKSRAPPDGFIEPVEGGPSQEVPLPTAPCLSGVSEVWLHPALFQKAMLQLSVFRTSDFPKRSNRSATLLRSRRGFTSRHWAVCETVPRPQDGPGCYNGRSNVTIIKCNEGSREIWFQNKQPKHFDVFGNIFKSRRRPSWTYFHLSRCYTRFRHSCLCSSFTSEREGTYVIGSNINHRFHNTCVARSKQTSGVEKKVLFDLPTSSYSSQRSSLFSLCLCVSVMDLLTLVAAVF